MNNKRTIILLIISIIIVIAATAGITFAYLSVSAVQTNPNSIATTCYDMTFTDSNVINITGYPMSSTSAFAKLTPYSFSLKNNCEANTDYQIILNVINTSSSNLLPYINYSLDGTTTQKLSDLIASSLPTGVTSSNVSVSYVINTGSLIGINTTKNFNLYLWIDESAGNDIMGSTFTAEIAVYSLEK